MASDLGNNEWVKLLAGALDRASTACFTIGVIAPIAAATYGVPGAGPQPLTVGIGAVIWLLAALALHLFARLTLGTLR